MAERFSIGYVAELLKTVPLFATCSKGQLKAVAGVTEIVEFAEESAICQEGGSDSDLYLIVEGTARVVVGGRARKHLTAGDFFGEIALLDGGPRTATVVADMPVMCLRVDPAGMRRVLDAEPGLAAAMLREVARRLRATDRTL